MAVDSIGARVRAAPRELANAQGYDDLAGLWLVRVLVIEGEGSLVFVLLVWGQPAGRGPRAAAAVARDVC